MEEISANIQQNSDNAKLTEQVSNESFFYYWLIPDGREEKVYWQVHEVDYADYKIGYYYISPNLLMPFDEQKRKYKSLFE